MSTSSEAAKARRHGTRGVEAMPTSTEGVEGGLPLLLPMVWGILAASREERRRTEANVYLSPSFIVRLSFSLHRGCMRSLWSLFHAMRPLSLFVVPPVPCGTKRGPSCENQWFQFEINLMIPATMSE